MKRLKYLTILSFIFGTIAFSCSEEHINPLNTGGDGDDDDEPIIIPPPPPPPSGNNMVELDSLG